MAVFAGSSVDYTNSGGTLAGSNSGLTLTGSTLVAVNGFNGGGLITGNDLGGVSLSTGALMSASLQTEARSRLAGRLPSLATVATELRTEPCSREHSMGL